MRVLVRITGLSRKAARERSWGRARGCTRERDLLPGLVPHKPDPGHDGTERGSRPVAKPGRSSWKI
ncbi:protein of unknown function [Methanoculleus bourgensis]|uniref:Uncharacterized protein n=1 Tax=Methanoculleus bourgensis TaxID=83986 RepID=A0A0X8XYK6_9EURY|nr:protein of unknown function [Methanoculleus bourgensis]